MVALPRRWVVADLSPRCPPRNVYFWFWESGVYPAGGCRMRQPHATQVAAGVCRMRPKSLPQFAGCDPSLCRSLASTLVSTIRQLLDAASVCLAAWLICP